MRVHREATETVTINTGKAIEFGFKVTPETYAMFAKNIYKNPILALVRELSCNARDAHKVAGQTRPFTIKVPTRWEPNFEIRDYGTGLSVEQIEKLYTTFFESTKQASDDFIGGLGIGSKSPLAYTDSFTVNSYHNGKEIVCIINKSDVGVPQLNVISVTDTTEPNGLLINVPVIASNSADITAFEQAIQRTFAYFDSPVEIIGNNLTITRAEYDILNTTANYGFRKNCPVDRGMFVIMGCIPYPVDINSLRLDNNAFRKYKGILFDGTSQSDQENVDLFFDIGSLSISLSREELQYDKRTIDAILARFEEVTQTFLAEMTAKIHAAPTYFKACEIVEGLSYVQRELIIAKQVKWGNHLFKNNRRFEIKSNNVPFHTVQEIDIVTQQPITKNVPNLVIGKLDGYQVLRNANNKKSMSFPLRVESLYDLDFWFGRINPYIIVKDIRCSDIVPRFMKFFEDNKISVTSNCDEVYTVYPHSSLADRAQIDANINAWLTANNLVRDVDLTVIYLSDMQEDTKYVKVRAPRGSGGKGKVYAVECYDLTGFAKVSSDITKTCLAASTKTITPCSKNVDTFKEKGKYYVRNSAGGCLSHVNGSMSTNSELFPLYRQLGIEEIFLVPLQRLNTNIKGNWIELNQNWFDTNIDAIINLYLLMYKKNDLGFAQGVLELRNKYGSILSSMEEIVDAIQYTDVQGHVFKEAIVWLRGLTVSSTNSVNNLMSLIIDNTNVVTLLAQKGLNIVNHGVDSVDEVLRKGNASATVSKLFKEQTLDILREGFIDRYAYWWRGNTKRQDLGKVLLGKLLN